MADRPHFSQFQLKFQTGDNPILRLDDDEFLRNHTKVLLRSNESSRVWKVKLDGHKLANGWEVFATDHKLKDGDVLDFKHDGDENFHVTVSSRSDSGDIEHPSSSYVESEDAYFDDDDVDTTDDDDDDDDDDDEDEDEDEDNDDDDDDDDERENDLGNISARKNTKAEGDSSSSNSFFVTASVTRYSLGHDRLDLSRNFTLSFGEHKKACDIDLVNEQGRRWTLILTKNSSSGVFYIRRGWTNFCVVNKLSQGDYCKFKLVENGEKPVLFLCPQESDNGSEEEAVAVKSRLGKVSKGKEKKTHSSFLTLKYTPSRHSTGQLSLPLGFTRENGIDKSGEITLLNKDGRKWSSYLKITGRGRSGSEWFYLRRGWRELCKANGVKINDSFVMELIKEDANVMFKFCYKIENKGEGNRRGRKKRACEIAEETPMVETGGRARKKGRTRVSNKTSTNSRTLQSTQPTSCSVSDQVATVKRGILDTLKTLREFQAELEIREHNLEASLQNIEALGERILGISKYLQ